jgi:hypothetical protein
MNLHAIAGPIVAAVNPPVLGDLLRCTGYTTAPTGHRSAAYADPEPMPMQVQGLTGQELRLVESLNIQGVKRAIHLPGDVKGVDRATNAGGDLVRFGNDPSVPPSLAGSTWLVTLVMETWDTGDWCRVAAVKQNDV